MILVGGENLIDLIQRTDDPSGAGFTAVPGGSCYNVALALGRLDMDVAYATPVSSDGFGDRLAQGLTAAGVRLAGGRPANPTSMAVVTFAGGQPAYQFYREKTAERQVDAEMLGAMLTGVTLFHVGSLALIGAEDTKAWIATLAEARSRGIITAVDPNVRPTMITDRAKYTSGLFAALAHADIIKLSDEDLAWLYPDLEIADAFDRFAAETSAKLTVLTRGPAGALLLGPEARADVPGIPVPALVDTVGAGDTFMSALLASVSANVRDGAWDVLDANKLATVGTFAAEAAAINCGREGCDPPVRTEVASAAAVLG